VALLVRVESDRNLDPREYGMICEAFRCLSINFFAKPEDSMVVILPIDEAEAV